MGHPEARWGLGCRTRCAGEERHGRGWSTGRVVTVSALTAVAIAGGVLFFAFHGKAQSAVDESKSLLNGATVVAASG